MVVRLIREVLIEHWDPIGVMSDPDWPRDEYDSYIGGVYRCLAQGESAEAIARHLCFIEETTMGFRPLPEVLLPVALRLKAIDVSLSSEA
ncbi:hypothetical protein SAMN04487938_3674 [Lysobacter sp. cf310]|nr:hypothetical protein SAMN04487938_3674 [Lysobacter sp. cf310]